MTACGKWKCGNLGAEAKSVFVPIHEVSDDAEWCKKCVKEYLK